MIFLRSMHVISFSLYEPESHATLLSQESLFNACKSISSECQIIFIGIDGNVFQKQIYGAS